MMLFGILQIFMLLLLQSEGAKKSKKNNIDTCSGHHFFRVECGWRGIGKKLCESRGCCYDSSIRRSIWCFHKDMTLKAPSAMRSLKRPHLKSCGVNKEAKQNCGWPGISKEVCRMRGCCYNKSQKNTYWCYKSDRVHIEPIVMKILQCTASCNHLKWSDINRTAVKCKTDEVCWSEVASEKSADCLRSCKVQESILEFISNVSSCLHIDDEVGDETHQECDFQLSCWVERHGHSAMQCYQRFSKYLEGVTAGQIDIEPEKDLSNVVTPLREPPEEEGMEEHNDIVKEILRQQLFFEETDINHERSVLTITSRINEEPEQEQTLEEEIEDRIPKNEEIEET